LFGDGCVDAVLIGIGFEHVVVGECEKLFVVGDHEHFVLFVDPPMVLLPLLVVDVHHFREELILIGLVVGDVVVEG
jgi:hypothetical protein